MNAYQRIVDGDQRIVDSIKRSWNDIVNINKKINEIIRKNIQITQRRRAI